MAKRETFATKLRLNEGIDIYPSLNHLSMNRSPNILYIYGPLIVGNLRNSKTAETEALEPLKS
jgi:hypothetical protein